MLAVSFSLFWHESTIPLLTTYLSSYGERPTLVAGGEEQRRRTEREEKSRRRRGAIRWTFRSAIFRQSQRF